MTRKLPEILTGLFILVAAAVFLAYALGRARALSGGGYPLKAQFSDIGALTVGADVKLSGVVVGHVVNEALDPRTYAAVVTVAIDNQIKLPTDTAATISSEGLLGGSYVGLSPGGADTMLQPGQSFAVTQSAINIENLLGQFIFNMGKSGGAAHQSGGQNAAPANPSTPSGGAGTP